MADIPLSKHFFYYMLQNDVPPGYKPILQIIMSRKTKNGLRFKMYDGFFIYNTCYAHDPDLAARLPDIDSLTPKVRVINYEFQNTGTGRNGDQNETKAVLNILDMEVLDLNANTENLNSDYPLGDPAPYVDYMAGQPLEPQDPEFDEKPAKRPRIVPDNHPAPAAAVVPAKPPPPPRRLPNPVQIRQSVAAGGDQNITPISMITPFLNKWRICGICTLKSLRNVNSAQKGPMKVLEFHICDEHGKTIKVTAWNEQAEEIDAIVNETQMFYVSGDQGCIRKKNVRFNYTDCDYEINLNRNCLVVGCNDRLYEPPQFSIKRRMISQISNNDDIVDIMGVIDKIGEKSNVTVKATNKEVPKRDITIVDESSAAINITVWDDKADDDNLIGQVGDILAIKTARIKEYNGSLSLTLLKHSTIEVNPADLPGVNELYAWYTEIKPTAEIKLHSVGGGGTANFANDFRSIGAIKNSSMIESIANGIFVFCKCEIIEVRRDNPYYDACVKCNKKVTNSDYGLRCEKCNITNPQSKQRYMLNVCLSDGLDTTYVTLFDELAQGLLHISAEELDQARQRDEREYNEYFDPILFQSVVVRMKVINDYYNDQHRKKFTVNQIKPVPFPQFDACLDATLQKLEDL